MRFLPIALEATLVSDAERKLVAALVHVIAMDLANPVESILTDEGISKTGRSNANGKVGQRCEHHFQSYLEIAFGALLPFEVFQPLDHDNRPRRLSPSACSYSLRLDLDDVEAHVLNANPTETIGIEQLISACLGLSCGQCGNLPTTRELFEPPREYLPLMQQLARNGYAGKITDQFRWTDKIAPAMRAAFLWDDQLQDFGDQEAHLRETMWNTMPAEAKQRYFFDRFDPLGFAIYKSECWAPEERNWTGAQPTRPVGEIRFKGGGVTIARELYAQFVAPFRV